MIPFQTAWIPAQSICAPATMTFHAAESAGATYVWNQETTTCTAVWIAVHTTTNGRLSAQTPTLIPVHTAERTGCTYVWNQATTTCTAALIPFQTALTTATRPSHRRPRTETAPEMVGTT